MFRRALSVAAATGTTTTPTITPLAPRSDVDLVEQRRMVAEEKAAHRAKLNKQDRNGSLYGSLAPQEEARVMEFNRHSLRLLVLEAHNRQVVQTRDLATTAAATPMTHHQDPNRTTSSMADSSDGHPERSRGPITTPPEGHLDLTATHNFNALLQDIDTLMAVAQQKPPRTRDRILNQTYEQLARLSLWNDLQ